LFAFVLAAFAFCFLPLLPLALFSFAGTRIKRVNEQQQCVAGLSISKKKKKGDANVAASVAAGVDGGSGRSIRSCRRGRSFQSSSSAVAGIIIPFHRRAIFNLNLNSQLFIAQKVAGMCVCVCYQQKYQYIYIHICAKSKLINAQY